MRNVHLILLMLDCHLLCHYKLEETRSGGTSVASQNKAPSVGAVRMKAVSSSAQEFCVQVKELSDTALHVCACHRGLVKQLILQTHRLHFTSKHWLLSEPQGSSRSFKSACCSCSSPLNDKSTTVSKSKCSYWPCTDNDSSISSSVIVLSQSFFSSLHAQIQ